MAVRHQRARPSRVHRPGQGRLGAAPLLLDTHAWVWLLEGATARWHRATTALLEAAAARRALVVSDISFWEIGIKAAKGKLELTLPATLWLQRAAQAPGIQSLAVTREILVLSTQLDGTVHGDPADRILVASAQLHGLSLVTADAAIVEAAATLRTFDVIDIRR